MGKAQRAHHFQYFIELVGTLRFAHPTVYISCAFGELI
jgi:hypothetical protein